MRFRLDRAGMNAALRCESLSTAAVFRPTRRIRSVLFDTAAGDLGRKDIVLRGVELHGASFVELSWSRPVDRGRRNAIKLRVPALDVGKMVGSSESLRRSIADRPLEARCIAETERRERLLEMPDARIVVAFDDGFVECGGRRALFHEIELRLLRGAEGSLWRLAAELSRRLPLRCSPMSEIERALTAIAGHELAPVKARRVVLAPDASLDEAIVATIGSCLDQFLANWPALAHSHAPEESIHQMRVALRRMRAGVGLLRRGVDSHGLDQAGIAAKRIADTLGEARNLDILLTMLTDGQIAQNSDPTFYSLLDAVECRRTKAHAAVQALIGSREATQFALDLRATLAGRAWTAAPSLGRERDLGKNFDASAPGSARAFAAFSLERLHRKAMKKSEDLASLTPEHRHEARIAFKKARYAAEFFETLFDARAEARKYQRRSGLLQDALGAFNDMAVASKLLREIGADGDGALSSAVALAVDSCEAAQSGEATDWKKVERTRKKLKPFWR